MTNSTTTNVYPLTTPVIQYVIRTIINNEHLDHGNAEVFGQDGGAVYTLEAPNHVTTGRYIEKDTLTNGREVFNHVIACLNAFDPELEFMEQRDREFGIQTNCTPEQFKRMLNHAQKYFKAIAIKLDNL